MKSFKTPLTTLAVAAAILIARDANATNCSNNGGYCETFTNSGSGAGTAGILAQGNGGYGVYGRDSSGYGVFGSSSSGYGIYGSSFSSSGVYGDSNSGYGVYGSNSSASAGVSAIYGTSSAWNGVEGVSSSSSHAGVAGTNTAGASAVWGSSTSSGGYGVYGQGYTYGVYGHATQSGSYDAYFDGGVGVNTTGKYYQNGTCVAGCSSDQKLKKNIEPLRDALDTLLQLKGVTFEWKNPEEQGKNQAGKQTGFVAQDVEKIFPQWVGEDSKGSKTLVVQPSQLGALEVESIRVLKAENDELRMRVVALEVRRGPVISLGANGAGLGLGGIALAGAVLVSRRKRGEGSDAK